MTEISSLVLFANDLERRVMGHPDRVTPVRKANHATIAAAPG